MRRFILCALSLLAVLWVPLSGFAAANRAPNAVNDVVNTPINQSVIVSVKANDSDPDGNALTVTSAIATSNGSVVVNGGETVTYTPRAGFYGTDSFTYTISDGLASATATVTVVVNAAPIALDDTGSTLSGVPVTVSVLENDIDPNGDIITIVSAPDTANASVQIHGTNITYTPNVSFHGTDTVTYTIQDTYQNKATAKVVFTVYAPPSAADNNVTMQMNTTATINALEGDTDPDGDALTLLSITSPANGTAVISSQKVVYTPKQNFYGNDTFKYTIEDARGAKDSAMIHVYVNAPPDAVNDTQQVDMNVSTPIPVLVNDSDPNGNAIAITNVSTPSHGSATINDKQIIYTPAVGYCGADTFTYTISDGKGGSDTATVSLVVNAPPNADNDKAIVTYNTPLLINVLDNDRDPNGDPITIDSISQPSHGTVSIVDNKILYTPTTGYYGSDSFTYTIKDTYGKSDTATVSINVLQHNDLPVAKDDVYWTYENLSIAILVLENDFDPDGNPLSVISVTQPSVGKVELGKSGVVYVPQVGYTGNTSFQYTISDGNGGTATAKVNLTIYKAPSTLSVGSPSIVIADGTAGYQVDVEQSMEDTASYSAPKTGYLPIDPMLLLALVFSGVAFALFYLRQRMNKKQQ